MNLCSDQSKKLTRKLDTHVYERVYVLLLTIFGIR